MPVVAVVTINWNGWPNTLTCLEALRQTRGADWHLFIVDNGSTDDSANHLKDLGDDVTTIWSPTNGGWTGGNNLGVSQALAQGYDHILLLNNDAFVAPDALAEFLAAHSKQPKGILGGVLKSADGSADGPAAGIVRPRTGTIQWIHSPAGQSSVEGVRPSPAVMGAALFAHRSVFEAVGEFDDQFYLYYDETDWCARAVEMGYACFFAERAIVRHVEAASTGGVDSPLVTYFMTRNGFLYGERHCSVRQRFEMARMVFGRIRKDAKQSSVGWWPLTLRHTTDPLLRARFLGAMHYLVRRFGDCPQVIRDLQQAPRRIATSEVVR